MEIVSYSISVDIAVSFKPIDNKFKKHLDDALKVKKSLIAFDLDFKYEGLGDLGRGCQVNRDNLVEGDYTISAKDGGAYEIKACCVINEDLMFRDKKDHATFVKALKSEALSVSISSVCNNGESRQTYWSMECDPAIKINNKQINFKEA